MPCPPYREAFVEALSALGRATASAIAAGGRAPILVGGAVVEFDTAGSLQSNDFDFVSSDDEPFAAALVSLGFIRGDGKSSRTGQFSHPKLGASVELVSGPYFDGNGDRDRVRIVEVEGGEVWMASTEDLIADRLGQWVSSERRDPETRLQALTLFLLAEEPDLAYLDLRIRQDTAGEMGLVDLREMADA